MNCTEAREHLPGLLYADLPPDRTVELEKHLAGCPACAGEYASLQRLRRSLDVLPAPSLHVDLPRLYQAAARQQIRKSRWWRRAASASVAVAAAVLMAFVMKLEIRADGQQFVIRWGRLPEAVSPAPTPLPDPGPIDKPVVTAAEIQLLKDLIHALAADIESRDDEQKAALARLQARLLSIQSQVDQNWQSTERNVAALYVLSQKGGKQ